MSATGRSEQPPSAHGGEGPAADGGDQDAWLVVRGTAVPEPWRARGRPAMLVPLLPGEVARLLAGQPAEPELTEEDEELATLVARGLTASQIARELGISLRATQYRLAGMRRRVGAGSTPELAALLSRRGFG